MTLLTAPMALREPSRIDHQTQAGVGSPPVATRLARATASKPIYPVEFDGYRRKRSGRYASHGEDTTVVDTRSLTSDVGYGFMRLLRNLRRRCGGCGGLLGSLNGPMYPNMRHSAEESEQPVTYNVSATYGMHGIVSGIHRVKRQITGAQHVASIWDNAHMLVTCRLYAGLPACRQNE
ncbi:hypothetical protein OBBRIDRAFT_828947 [Obba rivulosa]|uniref:Uncharacterized protein n=1 Tax=Obba rivulosa TaxID=1052685 RepID=A0A8E2DG08_9APHY|nr:hypothetical protein OBBRIDRAFT_828947 [Obba rivulosa]